MQTDPMARPGYADSQLPPSIRRAMREQTPVAQVEFLLRSGKTEARFAFRASIVWRLWARGQGTAEVAKELGTSTKTVRKWGKRFKEKGLRLCWPMTDRKSHRTSRPG